MSRPINMHEARTALNRDPEVREWAEQWLKNKERAARPAMSDDELDKHWLYVRPERMHEGAIEAVTAYRRRTEEQRMGEDKRQHESGREPKGEGRTTEPVKGNTDDQSSLPLYLRDASDGNRGNAQDEKDKMEE